ncbi:hypothetical protein [Streptomyces sp. 150FB]|uniref:hypothetical protein n=1 Tax=Streptomyces sp. 150FB TaxID=1576605 RepID=UPI0012378F73|nr:hypothetical protein [Streptomyces sp. 150FB]
MIDFGSPLSVIANFSSYGGNSALLSQGSGSADPEGGGEDAGGEDGGGEEAGGLEAGGEVGVPLLAEGVGAPSLGVVGLGVPAEAVGEGDPVVAKAVGATRKVAGVRTAAVAAATAMARRIFIQARPVGRANSCCRIDGDFIQAGSDRPVWPRGAKKGAAPPSECSASSRLV